MSAIKLGVIMDPISDIKPAKDTTLAMLLEAQARGYELHYMELGDLWVESGRPGARSRTLTVRDDAEDWYDLNPPAALWLDELDLILMRKDPPVDNAYLYATQILDLAEHAGTLVVNRPQALRDFNEKLAINRYPQFVTPTRVDADMSRLREFVREHGDTIIKPLDGMGGSSIFRLRANDPNLNVVLETLTARGSRYAMIQRYLPEISAGDKRVLVINGKPWPKVLARIPLAGESRGNLAAGGRGVGQDLSERDREIANALGPQLVEQGLYFVGLDIIGDALTEVNVTSPTCVRELDAQFGSNICAGLFDVLESKLQSR